MLEVQGEREKRCRSHSPHHPPPTPPPTPPPSQPHPHTPSNSAAPETPRTPRSEVGPQPASTDLLWQECLRWMPGTSAPQFPQASAAVASACHSHGGWRESKGRHGKLYRKLINSKEFIEKSYKLFRINEFPVEFPAWPLAAGNVTTAAENEALPPAAHRPSAQAEIQSSLAITICAASARACTTGCG